MMYNSWHAASAGRPANHFQQVRSLSTTRAKESVSCVRNYTYPKTHFRSSVSRRRIGRFCLTDLCAV